MNNLRKFATEASYSAATLNYPAVSWVVSTDTVHYDLSGDTPTPPVANDKVIMASYSGSGEATFALFNCESSSSGDITSITVDNVEVNPITCEGDYVDASQTYIVKYTLNTTSVYDWFSGDLGCGASSDASKLDILIPSQITTITNIPSHVEKIIVEATTPPYVEALSSSFNGTGIYVPDELVNTYKAASGWDECQDKIFPISQYSGNLPV